MSMYPISLLVATISFTAALLHLGQKASTYYDFVALAMVLGGSLAVGLVSMPWDAPRELRRGIRSLFKGTKKDGREVVATCLKLIQTAGTSSITTSLEVDSLPVKILRDGKELVLLGLETDRIETILRERVFQSTKRYKKVANAFKTLAKYPPAFGLMGTVLGLVNLMLTITKGVDAKEAGLEMAVALVATLYGLILSNLVLSPAGEYVMKEAQGEEEFGEVALQAILLMSQRTSLLESQELLNSFVGEQHQVDLLAEWGQANQESEAA